MTGKIDKSEEDWRAELSEEAYAVCRCSATEPPFSGQYWDETRQGVYRCAACGAALYSSRAKYDSGTGWPSFTAPIGDGAVLEKPDRSHGMIRTEIVCAQCDSHLGHVFPDGPAPTGLRYCMNSAALKLEPDPD